MSIMQVKCPSCGAGMDMEPNQAVAHCKYCGSDFVLETQWRSPAKAEAIYGYRYRTASEDMLQNAAMFWMVQEEFMPVDLPMSLRFLSRKLTYVPIYTMAVKYTASYQAQVGIDNVKTVTEVRNGQSYRRNVTETTWQLASGSVEGEDTIHLFGFQTERLPVIENASAKGFIHKGLVPEKLSSMKLENVSIMPNQKPSLDTIHRKLDYTVERKVNHALTTGKKKNIKWSMKTEVTDQSLVYVPVWILTCSYREETYEFLVDGCNIETVIGDRPIDRDMQQMQYKKETAEHDNMQLVEGRAAFNSCAVRLSFWIGLPLFIVAFVSNIDTLKYVGGALLAFAVILYFASRGTIQKATNQKPQPRTLPNAPLRKELLSLYANSSRPFKEKQKDAVKLASETARSIERSASAQETGTPVQKSPRKRKRGISLSRTSFYIIAVVLAALLIVGCWAAVSAIVGKKGSETETSSNITENRETISTATPGTFQEAALSAADTSVAYKTKTLDEVNDEGQWEFYNELSPRPSGIGMTQDLDFQPESQFLVQIGGAWYQGYDDPVSGERFIYLYCSETTTPTNTAWGWYRLDSTLSFPDYAVAAPVNQGFSGLEPIGEWKCTGLYDPYSAVAQVDCYQAIPTQYLSPVTDSLELHISTSTLTQIVNGKEYASFPWSTNGQTINVTLPEQSEYYGYFQVDENTIHEFYADNAIYVYTRK